MTATDPPSTKRCPYCAEEIQQAAIVCKHCHRDLRSAYAAAVASPRAPSRGVAAVLSLFIPGAGHMYLGNVKSGLMWLLATLTAYALLILPGLILHLCCIISAAKPPSAGTAQQSPTSSKAPGSRREWIQLTKKQWAAVIALVLVVAIVSQVNKRRESAKKLTALESMIAVLAPPSKETSPLTPPESRSGSGSWDRYSYKYVIRPQGVGVTFNPFLPRNDEVVIRAMRHISRELLNIDISSDSPVLVNGYINFYGGKNVSFMVVKEDTGEVHSFVASLNVIK